MVICTFVRSDAHRGGDRGTTEKEANSAHSADVPSVAAAAPAASDAPTATVGPAVDIPREATTRQLAQLLVRFLHEHECGDATLRRHFDELRELRALAAKRRRRRRQQQQQQGEEEQDEQDEEQQLQQQQQQQQQRRQRQRQNGAVHSGASRTEPGSRDDNGDDDAADTRRIDELRALRRARAGGNDGESGAVDRDAIESEREMLAEALAGDGTDAQRPLPFAFYLLPSGVEITRTLGDALDHDAGDNEDSAARKQRRRRRQQQQQQQQQRREDTDGALPLPSPPSTWATATEEHTVRILYQPQALFRIRSVSRCSATVPGHSEAILAAAFSPDSRHLATGSGDATVRVWDPNAQLPIATLTGHRNWVLAVAWSPDAALLASGGMDGVVRVWTRPWSAHTLARAPTSAKKRSKREADAKRVNGCTPQASHDGGAAVLTGHTKWITCIAWEPYHLCRADAASAGAAHARGTSGGAPACERLCSAGKDGTVRVWNARTRACERVLTGHTAAVTCVRWGGRGLIYSASQDRTVKVWRPDTGALVRTLRVHGHWVNTMALSTDYVLRCGAFPVDDATARMVRANATTAKDGGARDRDAMRYSDSTSTGEHEGGSDGGGGGGGGGGGVANADTDGPADGPLRLTRAEAREAHDRLGDERLCAGSDDYTLSLIDMRDIEARAPEPIRMTGHQQLVNHVCFSPDARSIASASFDKSVRVWDGTSGKFVAALRQHVQAVYMCCWSADSRLVASASRDSTIKVFDVRAAASRGGGGGSAGRGRHMLKRDLPGHADEVFAIDWAVDGRVFASGGKDKVLKLWR